MRVLFSLFFIFHISLAIQAQKFTISGFVRDAETSESLVGASVNRFKTNSGTTANAHGFYSITFLKDSIYLFASNVGYQPIVISFFLDKDTVINFNMLGGKLLKEVVVSATQADAIHETSQMSSVTVPIEQVKALPALLGEIDILKTLQLMPGVQSGNEGSTGLYVRGGGADQNLMLLDGVPIYNAAHLFGFFSVFNADAINQVELIKGGFPARYGGRLSSVIDIHMKEGNMKKIKGEGSIGIVAAKVTVEGPIIKDKTSFILSARRTYIDLLAQPIIKRQTQGARTGYYFYDLNFKINHIMNPRNRFYLSNYSGNDKAYSDTKDFVIDNSIRTDIIQKFGLKWGNVISALRWNHVYGPQLFSNVTGTYSRYLFDVSQSNKVIGATLADNAFYGNQYNSGIRDWAIKIDYDYLPAPDHFIRFGFGHTWHRFSPGIFTYNSSEGGDTATVARITNANEVSAYFEDDWKMGNRLKLNVGFHGSAFGVDNKWYHSVQPRLSSRFLLPKDFSIKASFSSMAQFIHLLTNAGIGLPTDLWVPSTARIKPQQAWQAAFGFAKTYLAKYEFSLEAYYKKMSNLIEYKDGASYLNLDGDWQDKVASGGKGKSYGLEMLIQKKTGRITGWLGYTLSKSLRQFDGLNFGKEYPYKYDRRHDISLALMHEWNKKMDFSMVWVYGTGNAITMPIAFQSSTSGSFDSRNYFTSPVTYYGDRNSYRMKSYHRLDLSFSWWKDKKWGQRKWTVGVYNAYNRLNPFFIDLQRDHQAQGGFKFIQHSLFPVIPFVSYNFKF